MKGVSWPYPSVVAGSLRTALVKAGAGDFSGEVPRELMEISVAGVFPVAQGAFYLPAPNDCVIEAQPREKPDRKEPVYILHRAAPRDTVEDEGCDWPDGTALRPVTIEKDFKPYDKAPAWWPSEKIADWLLGRKQVTFDNSFLAAAGMQVRDHVQLEADTGAAAENRLFATAGLSLTHLQKFGVIEGTWNDRHAEITLAARVEADGWNVAALDMLHPLGGERRLVHWQANGSADLWKPPYDDNALSRASKVRMMLATPAIFAHGWRPGWLDANLEGPPPGTNVRLRLVGVCTQRWKAVSGWSLAEPRGPKAIKRLVPAGGVYFFDALDDPAPLAQRWLQPVSDHPQDRNDGFGLAVWGTW
jgi:CRISPR-associated protein Cmr3